jgi:hypothetical protein
MKRVRLHLLLIAASLIAALLLSSCSSGTAGVSGWSTKDDPKNVFRSGYGSITIKYQPPPEPIFKIGNATSYLDFDQLFKKYSVIEEPLVITYMVKTSVTAADITFPSSSPAFNNEIKGIVKSWTYTKWGQGKIKLKIEVGARKITVDMTGLSTTEAQSTTSMPKIGSAKEVIASVGWDVVQGSVQ